MIDTDREEHPRLLGNVELREFDRRRANYREHFNRGFANAEEHLRRMIAGEDLIGCPCLGCRRGMPRYQSDRGGI